MNGRALFLALTIAFGALAAGVPVGDVKKLRAPFVTSLFKLEKDARPTNVLASPASLRAVLDLVRAGAAKKTHTELDAVVAFPVDEPPPLVGTNTVTVPPNVKLTEEWKKAAVDRKTLFTKVDPKGDAQKLVITNRVEFAGTWQTQFDAKQTTHRTFTLADLSSKPVKMMHLRAHLPAARLPDGDVVELAYADGSAMILVVPKVSAGKFAAPNLARVETKLKAQDVELWLPRFTLETKLDLERPLTALGVKSAWCTALAADFSALGAGSEGPLCLESVTQSVKVAVDEKGTVASASTEARMVMAEGERESGPLEVRADHPFAFVILAPPDPAAGAAGTAAAKREWMFAGRVADPAPDVVADPPPPPDAPKKPTLGR